MAYRDDINALNPDHLWVLDPALTDSVGSLTITNTGCSTSGAQICEDITTSLQSNGTGDRLSIATSSDVDGALDRKAVCGWFRTTAIQLPPKSVYREGTTGNQFNLVLWAGNNLMLDVVNGSTVVQAFADQVCAVNRAYHLFARVEGTGFGNKVELYVDGIKQSITSPANGQLGAATLGARTAAQWSDPSGATEVGNTTVLLNGLVNGEYAMWATWSGANAQLTDTEIREVLFEKGAVASQTISSDTEANMQTALDAFADTVRPDEPLNIRVEALSGGGDLTLNADNITHDPKASIHVQYMGTDTLTWVNENGSNASIGSTPNGGTINFVEAVNVKVTALDSTTFNPIQGARVLMEADTGGPLTVGTDILAGLTDVNGELTGTLQFSSNQPVTGRVRKTSPYYKDGTIGDTITSDGADIVVLMVNDE